MCSSIVIMTFPLQVAIPLGEEIYEWHRRSSHWVILKKWMVREPHPSFYETISRNADSTHWKMLGKELTYICSISVCKLPYRLGDQQSMTSFLMTWHDSWQIGHNLGWVFLGVIGRGRILVLTGLTVKESFVMICDVLVEVYLRKWSVGGSWSWRSLDNLS